MSVPSITLNTGESRLCTMDFAALLARGETVTSVVRVDAIPSTAPPLSIGSAVYSGTIAQFRVAGYVSDTRYKITVFVTTSSGNTLKGEGFLQCSGPLNYSITPGVATLTLTGH